MQRTFIAIALALTLSCACASYINTQNYVKNPTTAVNNNETNFTSANGTFTLGSINAGELDIIGANVTFPAPLNETTPINYTASSWVANFRKLDAKALTASTNSSVSFTTAQGVSFSNGYAIAISRDNDTFTNYVPQLSVYQTKITGGNTTRLNITSNTNSSFNPGLAAVSLIGKTVYVFYYTNEQQSQINITNYAIGGTARGSVELTLTTGYSRGLSVVWGEALGNNQLYANWQEGPADARVFKYATIDVTKSAAVASTAATAWGSNYSCTAFSTDKKNFGDLCYFTNGTSVADKTINYYVRFNGTGFVPYTNVSLNASTQAFKTVVPYGPYIALVYTDSLATAGNTTYSYEIFNLDSWTLFKNRTTFLTTDDYRVSFYRVTSGGLYTLTYQQQNSNATLPTYSEVKVGLVLGSSYLTSVLGFIMTIVAGVLLF